MLENDHKIEDIKRHLYDYEDTVSHRTREGIIHTINHHADTEWKSEENVNTNEDMKKPKISIFKKFFLSSIIFFVASLVFALYMFTNDSTSVSSENIDIIVIGNAFTKGGEELSLEIEIVNNNKASLELANLLVSYPSGASDDATDYTRLPRIDIGTIKAGETITKNIKVILFGDERSNRNIKISLDYHPEGSNAIFTKEKEYGVTISSSPLSLFFDGPETATSDQPVSFIVKAVLNTSLPNSDTIMQVTYPNNFIYESSIPEPIFGNSIWSLENISVTNPITIAVKGRIIGQDQDQQVFHVYSGTTNSINKSIIDVVYNSLLHTITITKPFIQANILVNDTASAGENIRVRILWANNLPNRITDGEIIANIGGNAFDKTSVNSSEGFFDSINNQVIWNRNSIPELAEIEPGEKGEVSFNVKSTSLIGSLSNIKDPQITIDVSIKGRQPSLGSTYSDVNNFSKKIVKILTDFQIASSATYKSGSIPPKAENETKYNITWTLSNGSNTVNEGLARSELPIYVKWVGSLTPRENITYNEVTREVIWNIGSVRANTGSSYNREAIFTIALTPSISQIGSVPQLMKELFLSGKDAFTDTIIKSKRNAINTLISEDPNFKYGNERVVE